MAGCRSRHRTPKLVDHRHIRQTVGGHGLPPCIGGLAPHQGRQRTRACPCEHSVLLDDRPSAVSLPEHPLLGVAGDLVPQTPASPSRCDDPAVWSFTSTRLRTASWRTEVPTYFANGLRSPDVNAHAAACVGVGRAVATRVSGVVLQVAGAWTGHRGWPIVRLSARRPADTRKQRPWRQFPAASRSPERTHPAT
jgi:hypothetical protein